MMKSSSSIRLATAVATIGIAIASSAGAGIGATKPPDFWNYDPITGQKVSNSSPGVAPENLAGLLFRVGNTAGPSRADEVRAAALNSRFGNAWTRVSAAEFKTLVSTFGAEVTATMTPQQARAELARGQGLNRLAEQHAARERVGVPSYTAAMLAAHFKREDLLYNPRPSLPTNLRPTVSRAFGWSDWAIGMGTGLGLALILGGGLLMGRHLRHRSTQTA
jgi:hypothetical protein